MLTVLAPAKLNLTLEVLARRPDGYHDIRSIAQTISLCDRLSFRRNPDIEFLCHSPDWVAGKSLLARAVNLLRETTGYSGGAAIHIEKHIPIVSGLGGDSSGAAVVLRGLNKLWGLGLSHVKLAGLAAQLGSDVSFFLYGGTALLAGRGEIVTPLPHFPHCWVVLALPPADRSEGKTGRLYNRLETGHYTGGEITERFVEALKAGRPPALPALFNTFENIAFARSSAINVCREHLIKVGADSIHLAGSGPTLFTMAGDRSRADELFALFRQQKLECYLAETMAPVDG